MAEEQQDNVMLEADFLASLPELTGAKRPAGQSKDYQFFTNGETGQTWKAKLTKIENEEAAFAPNSLHISITVSPVDEAGKALRDNLDRPIVTESITHEFNELEMSSPDFDPKARIMGMIRERIKIGEARLVGIDKLREIADNWQGKGMFK